MVRDPVVEAASEQRVLKESIQVLRKCQGAADKELNANMQSIMKRLEKDYLKISANSRPKARRYPSQAHAPLRSTVWKQSQHY